MEVATHRAVNKKNESCTTSCILDIGIALGVCNRMNSFVRVRASCCERNRYLTDEARPRLEISRRHRAARRQVPRWPASGAAHVASATKRGGCSILITQTLALAHSLSFRLAKAPVEPIVQHCQWICSFFTKFLADSETALLEILMFRKCCLGLWCLLL